MARQGATVTGSASGHVAFGSHAAGAFEHLYAEHSPAVYRSALGVLANPSEAQDVVQDVFLRVWRQPDRFDAQRGSVRNYLRLMARSRALDVWREAQAGSRARERMKVSAPRLDHTWPDADPAAAAELRRDREVVAAAVDRLPEAQRAALLMVYWGGMTAEQIAERWGVPVGTVKSRIRLGLMKLRQRCERQLTTQPLIA